MSDFAEELVIVGNVGAINEVRYKKDGTPIQDVRIAVDRGNRRNPEGKIEPATGWYKVIITGFETIEDHTAFVSSSFVVGDRVRCIGRPDVETWLQASGSEHYVSPESRGGKPLTAHIAPRYQLVLWLRTVEPLSRAVGGSRSRPVLVDAEGEILNESA